MKNEKKPILPPDDGKKEKPILPPDGNKEKPKRYGVNRAATSTTTTTPEPDPTDWIANQCPPD